MYVYSMRKQFSHCEKCKYKFPHVTFVILLMVSKHLGVKIKSTLVFHQKDILILLW